MVRSEAGGRSGRLAGRLFVSLFGIGRNRFPGRFNPASVPRVGLIAGLFETASRKDRQAGGRMTTPNQYSLTRRIASAKAERAMGFLM